MQQYCSNYLCCTSPTLGLGGQMVDSKLFQDMMMLPIKLEDITKCSNMVATWLKIVMISYKFVCFVVCFVWERGLKRILKYRSFLETPWPSDFHANYLMCL